MNDSKKIEMRLSQLERYVWASVILWTVVVTASLVWNMVQIKHNTLEAARIQARAAYEKDIIYRRWNAGHGGVYVPVTEMTQPNPYLSDIPERDITTPLGKLLTLMNPAYMTRQVHELGEEEYGVRGHITSLNPIRVENSPDPWETKALQAFERGQTEISSLEEMKGEEYMRLMRPLITEKACLKCHAVQGYQEGDIRGGISVSLRIEPLRAIGRMNVLTLVVGHILLWLMGLGGVMLGTQRLRRSERERNRAEEEIKKYATELEHTNIRLQEADRLKSVFLANMSHELRTPLNSIIGFTGIMLQGVVGELNDEQEKQLNMVYDSAKHLLGLINDVLDLSKIEAGKIEITPSHFELKELIQTVERMILPMIEKKGLTLEVAISEAVPPTIFNDKNRIKQVLINLISNAIKFTESGEIRLAVRSSMLDPGSSIEDFRKEDLSSIQHPASSIVFSVSDTGIGIKPEHLPDIFDEFKQIEGPLKEKPAGTGLGLAISRKMVEMMGGHIWAQSEYGKGSHFRFAIPIKEITGAKRPPDHGQGEQARPDHPGSNDA